MCKLIVTFFLVFSLSVQAATPAVTEGDTQTFLGPIKVVGEIYKWVGGVLGTAAQATVAPITLYVETTGSDSNNCLTVGTACLTIQAAVNRIPKEVNHNVQITVGAGTFGGFVLAGFRVSAYPTTMIIEGTMAEPTLGSGGKTNATSDAVGGSTITLVDADGGWNVDELRGMSVQIGTARRVIRSNTASEITFAGTWSSSCNSKAYQILEQKTVITSLVQSLVDACIHVYNNSSVNSGFTVSRFKLAPVAGDMGVFATANNGFTLRDLWSVGVATGQVGFQIQHNSGVVTAWNITATGSLHGVNILNNPVMGQLRLFSYGNTLTGVSLQNAYGLGVFSVQLTADNNASTGISVLNCSGFTHSTSGFFTHVSANNNGGPGMVVGGGEIGIVGAMLTGTGNATFGVRVERFGRLVINGAATITGATGDFSLDLLGTVAGTWATDLAAAGDSITNVSDGTWIIRR